MTRRIPVSALSLCLFAWIALAFPAWRATAQGTTAPALDAATAALDAPLPLDPALTHGTLENGLHFYIRRNEEPKNRIFLRLIVKAGMLHEEDDARGVAHLLEHMAFNGTRHFEKQALVEYMESIGMRLGPGLNASTSLDETVYMINLPADNPAHLETAVRIIGDWISGMTLDPAEFDRERPVVIEEWRGSQGAQSRVRDRHLPVQFRGSRYADRLPINTPETIAAIDRDDLDRFYRTWYRPDRMALIAVGEIDPVAVEALVRAQLGQIPAATTPPPQEPSSEVPGHDSTLYSIVSDPEVPQASVQITRMVRPDTRATHGAFRQQLVLQLAQLMLTRRLQEKIPRGEAPYISAQVGTARLIRPVELRALTANVPETGIAAGLDGLVKEAARVKQHGFTMEELGRARTSLQQTVQLVSANLNKQASSAWVTMYSGHFSLGNSAPGMSYELALMQRFLPEITVDEANAAMQDCLDATNQVVLVTMPKKEGLVPPDQAALAAILDAGRREQTAAYAESATPDTLIKDPPKGSAIVATRERSGGITEWDLANGVRVVLRPTDFTEDVIVFAGFLPGGSSLAEDGDLVAAESSGTVAGVGGLGSMDLVALNRALAGKRARVTASVEDDFMTMSGQSGAADLQTMFELIYLRFMPPRLDTTGFTTIQNLIRQSLANRNNNPDTRLGDAFNRLMTQDHPRARPMTADRVNEMSLERSVAFYRERLADATGATFIFLGAFDQNALRPLVERYLGGLPAAGRREAWHDRGVRMPHGVHEDFVRAGMEPRSKTTLSFNGDFDMSDPAERTLFVATAQMLQVHLRNVLREELGGTYSITVEPRIRRRPVESYAMVFSFGSDPARAEELKTRIFSEIAKLKEEGPSPDRVADTQEAMLRTHETNMRTNAYWMTVLQDSYRYEKKPGAENLLAYPDTVRAVTPKAMRKALRRYLNTDNFVRVTLLPETADAQASTK